MLVCGSKMTCMIAAVRCMPAWSVKPMRPFDTRQLVVYDAGNSCPPFALSLGSVVTLPYTKGGSGNEFKSAARPELCLLIV